MKRPIEIWRPTRQQLAAAANKTVPDIVAPNLKVLLCGINPGLYTAAIGHHFGRPGNRFWPALHAGGITPRAFSPFEELQLLPLGYGITNIVARATATAADLSADELRADAKKLIRKVEKLEPKLLAVIGVGAYRVAFDWPQATIGLQDDRIGTTRIWVLPNPSGLNAHYQPKELGRLFAKMRKFADSL
jgi:TDG/mug DNA glycosylase family protein